MTDIDLDTEDSDVCSTTSLPVFSPPPSVATSRTSHGLSMRSQSPDPSVQSITSSMLERVYRHEYGRGFNNYSEVYHLPADAEELDRLDAQHNLFREIMGMYAPCMDEIMVDDVPGEPKTILDLGCGSGSWIMEAARDYPNCSAVAVDLVPMQSQTLPPNLRSEVDDINLGLEHFYGDFNVVHARLISSGIKDYEGLIHHINFVLKPGGLMDIMEFDFHMYDENYRRIEVSTSHIGAPWWPRWLAFLEAAIRSKGGDADAATHLHSWTANHASFEGVVYREFWVPASPWRRDSEFQIRMGQAMRDDIFAFVKSGRALLLGSGVPEQIVDELQRKVETELATTRRRYYVRLQCIFARKRRT
ncbi:S-adenosyl-L-methionine-dependent methyltransferase [Marasmius fiardii PR-910]|nr:S-adenosyl-L-methionine-dependent methyltransferase [Marasmius fiardii PR-910]